MPTFAAIDIGSNSCRLKIAKVVAHQLKALAEAVGLVRLHSAGPLLAVVGGSRTSAMARSQRVSNHRFRAAALWQPKYASVRRGWPAVVAAM